jgi:alkanesulfonate monooxygenase SsuD/methylene tetrahydromethanopterin reductase-like flavin-dependent oxidoreductase (luciferase family)
VRVGVQLPEVERPVEWGEQLAIARAAEECGFDSVWVGDHLLYRGVGGDVIGPWEAWTQLAALAQATERITLGPLVACLAFHPALVVAKMAATVQAVSGGRLVLGVGAGWNDDEFAAAGLPTQRKVSRFETAFGELRRWLADPALMPASVPRIPLMTGSSGPRSLAITLPHVDSWNCWWDEYGNTIDGFAALNATVTAPVERSACVLVTVDGGAGERPTEVPAVPHTALRQHLADLAEAGADEAILVLDPISEATVRQCGAVLALLDA